jgi:alpha-tubulin suppressor-like RCC1 family protein
MRLLLFFLGLQACDNTRACATGTVFLTMRFEGAATGADSVDVSVSIDGGSPRGSNYSRKSGATSTLEIDFPSGYPAGSSLTVTVEAKEGGAAIGSGMKSFPLQAGCTAAELPIGSSADLAGADFETIDFASTDLALKKVGDKCTLGDNCGVAFCVDGYCCASACTDQCAACDVAGKEGSCTAVTGTPHASHLACTGTGTPCQGTCDGINTGACSYGTATCSAATCSGGAAYQAGVCALGSCTAQKSACSDGLCGATTCQTVTQAVAGVDFTCALISDGTVRCWGKNDNGILGTDPASVPSAYAPSPVPGLSGVMMLGAGSQHVCAVVTGGNVVCWGNNTDGQLGQGTTDSNPHPSPSPVCTSGSGAGCVPLTGATAIYGGATNSCAIAGSGRVFCWGNDFKGQVTGASGTPVPNATEICQPGGCSGGHLGDTTAIQQLAIGYLHVLAMDVQGNVYCWGATDSGICGGNCPSGSTATTTVANLTVGGKRPIYIATAELTGYAVISDGTTANNLVRTWGKATEGELGNSTSTTVCASPAPVATVCIDNSCTNQLTGVTSVGTAYDTACAISGGAIHCWGTDNYGELGNGTVSAALTTIAVPSLLNAGAVEVSGQAYTNTSFCARLSNGNLRCWGDNRQGQLGVGMTGSAPSPSPVAPRW